MKKMKLMLVADHKIFWPSLAIPVELPNMDVIFIGQKSISLNVIS